MADISGRRDRNKKSPSVHYDMHRCTRGCDLHCFVAERNVDIGKCDYMGTSESVSTYMYTDIYICMCIYIYIYLSIYIRIPNHIERRSTWKPSSTDIDTTGHRYYIEKILVQDCIRNISESYNIDQHFVFFRTGTTAHLLLHIKI